MKNTSIANLLVASMVATKVTLLLATPNSLATPAGTSFQCHQLTNHPSDSSWATFVVTATGEKLGSPILLWRNQLGSTYTPEVRCKFVTNRLNIVVTNNGGRLSNLWLTVGRVNGQGVICYVNGVGGGCNGSNVLLTLSGQNYRNPGAALGDLLAYIQTVQTGGASGTPIQESGGQLYVNLEELVDAAGTAQRGRARFYCGIHNGQPATIANHPQRGDITVIVWTSDLSTSSWSSQQRCKQISKRFQQNQESGNLNYIVAGRFNGNPVLCASQQVYTEVINCSDSAVLMTLRSEYDYQEVIRKIASINRNMSASPVVYSVDIQTLYQSKYPDIDVDLWQNYSSESRNNLTSNNSTTCIYFLYGCPNESNRSEVQDKATIFTVIISFNNQINNDANKTISGSGVIIAKHKETYYVLTNEQIISHANQYEILTHDKHNHTVISIKRLSNTNLAILEFKSKKVYEIVEIGNTRSFNIGDSVYVAGDLYFDETQIYQLAEGQITDTAIPNQKDRIEYTNVTTRGMKGGPVLDNHGELVGIHLNAGSGIPISVFLEAAPSELLDFIDN
ncbi:hypothetical protein MC7420_2934 [Coleofasciculus chthonoplastes PCC 7420]|uniref:Trypsin domain protein n=1 Tax=Coleofasciculus chthonoplastes PCC 7420 TaxID=118168 RepID=B4VKH5_9CYAN|nr:COP23 domain-containing protein [Coleofasciculus chthonoplastes]EDX77610.1 hypothetical protein MC7420_2934 [Coleofasciculus chthonoplastes PCC 7420]